MQVCEAVKATPPHWPPPPGRVTTRATVWKVDGSARAESACCPLDQGARAAGGHVPTRGHGQAGGALHFPFCLLSQASLCSGQPAQAYAPPAGAFSVITITETSSYPSIETRFC